MPSLWGQCASAGSNGQPRVEGDNVARNASGSDCDVAFFGAEELRSGRHVARFSIVKSQTNSGSNINIGVVDASVASKAGDCGREVAWAYNAFLGKLRRFTNPVKSSGGARKQLGPALDGKAEGGVVEVTVDMEARRMLVSVNGEAAVDAGVDLPGAVRVWCSLYCPGDAVQLESVRSSGGGAGTAGIAAMPSLWGQCASAGSNGQPRVEGDNVARNASGSDCDVAFFGAEELRSGRHVARFSIVKSQTNSGSNINIGVVDASVAATAGDCGREVAWAYNAFLGKLRRFTNPVESSGGARKQLGPALDGKAEGGVVEVTVDMEARRMLVSVNGEAAVDAGVDLPGAVRVWCSLYCSGDAVQLESVRSSGGGAGNAGIAAMPSLWGQCASAGSNGQPRVEGDNVARNASGSDCDVAFFGAEELRSGRHVARFSIVKSQTNSGSNINIGVVDASVAATAGDCGREVAWAYNAFLGKLRRFTNPVETCGPEGKQLGPALDGKAEGGVVEVTVDMEARRMLVSVNGEAAVDAGVDLPGAVRVWCSLYCSGDAVQLESVRSSGGGAGNAGIAATPSLWGQCASAGSNGQPRVEGDNVARNASGSNCDVAFFGAEELRSGRHVARFSIVKSQTNSGSNINIGVVDASVAATAGDCGREVAWAYNAFLGKLRRFTNPVETCGPEGKQLGPALDGKAEGGVVEVTVDMEARRMLVSVNGEAAVDAGVDLPGAVRVWCSLYCPGDAVQLESVRSSGGGAGTAGIVALHLQLEAMGFADRGRNAALLQQFDGDVAKVVDHLLLLHGGGPENGEGGGGVQVQVETELDNGDSYEYDPFDAEDEDQEASQLGEGTFGSTHRMRSKADGRAYAVKMIKIKKAGVPLEVLKQEAMRLSTLHHENIVRYYTACTFKKGRVFAIVTELLEGGSFLQRVRAGASQQEAARWVGEVASALAHMHSLRMLHRDVKPDNVLLDGGGHAKLIDVGLACTLGSKSRVSTKSGGAVGSNLYMSPEKGSGKSYDSKDDVWALGCMLVGGVLKRPMEDMGLNTIGTFALNRPGVDDLITEARRASPDLGGLVQALLSQDPARRPTAQEVADGLLPERKVSTDILAPPKTWAMPMADPLQAVLVVLPDGSERAEVVRLVSRTLPPGVRITSVSRVQNLPMWQTYAVKRQTVLMRESSGWPAATSAARYERPCLFHGCPAHIVPKIVQQGFNRSFTGTTSGRAVYGKGVYFARDASYSLSPEYSPPDAGGKQRIFMVRVVVGEFCRGRPDQLAPDARQGDVLFDSTVDDLADPSIYVTYHDAQSYPDYLIELIS